MGRQNLKIVDSDDQEPSKTGDVKWKRRLLILGLIASVVGFLGTLALLIIDLLW